MRGMYTVLNLQLFFRFKAVSKMHWEDLEGAGGEGGGSGDRDGEHM